MDPRNFAVILWVTQVFQLVFPSTGEELYQVGGYHQFLCCFKKWYFATLKHLFGLCMQGESMSSCAVFAWRCPWLLEPPPSLPPPSALLCPSSPFYSSPPSSMPFSFPSSSLSPLLLLFFSSSSSLLLLYFHKSCSQGPVVTILVDSLCFARAAGLLLNCKVT